MSEEIRAKDIVPHKTSFSAGDGFYGDGNTSFFMEANDLLSISSQASLENGVSSNFEIRDENNKWHRGDSCSHDGFNYIFLQDHYGPWDPNVVAKIPVELSFRRMKETFIHQLMNKGEKVVLNNVYGGKKTLNAEDIKFSDESLFILFELNSQNMNNDGYISKCGGVVVPLSGFLYSDYVDVDYSRCGIIRSDIEDDACVAFYDIGKNFISSFKESDLNSLGYERRLETRYIEFPNNTKFVRFCCRQKDVEGGVFIKIPKKNTNDIINLTEHVVDCSEYSSGYISNNGTVVSFEGIIHSPLIPLMSPILVIDSFANSFLGVSWYDAFGIFISSYSDNIDEKTKRRVLTVPEKACFFACNLLEADLSDGKYVYYSLEQSSAVSCLLETNELIRIEKKVLNDSDFVYGKYIIGSSGNEIAFPSFKCSKFIDIRNIMRGTRIMIQSLVVDLAGVAFYDEGKYFISGINGSDLSAIGYTGAAGNGQLSRRVFDVPRNACYVRLNLFSKDTANDAEVIYICGEFDDSVLTPYEELIHSCLCVGDSITVGADYTTGVYTGTMSTNYPYYLGKLTKMIVAPSSTAASAGDSASNCWSRWFENDNVDVTAYDAFLVWLGTNNGLTDTLDEDVIPYENYNDYVESETGFYCKILSKIISINPEAKIFLGTVFASKGNVVETNSVIQKIASMPRYLNNIVGVVDNSHRNFGYPEEVVHPNNGVHFGKVGNMILAEHWRDGIRKAIKSNLSLMEYPRIV